MPFGVGTKGNKGGRKSKAVEMELAREVITQQALVELANSVVYKRLKRLVDSEDEKDNGVQGVALPITLKGMTEKKDITSAGKPIPILGYVSNDISNQEDNKPEQED